LIASAAARLPPHKIAMEFMLLGQDLSAQATRWHGQPGGAEGHSARRPWLTRELVRSAPLVVETLKRFRWRR
jgi:hypothetical protein